LVPSFHALLPLFAAALPCRCLRQYRYPAAATFYARGLATPRQNARKKRPGNRSPGVLSVRHHARAAWKVRPEQSSES
jgi:hypothetical protein